MTTATCVTFLHIRFAAQFSWLTKMASTSSDHMRDLVDIIINDMDKTFETTPAKSKKKSKTKGRKDNVSSESESRIVDSQKGITDLSEELNESARKNTHAVSHQTPISTPESDTRPTPATVSFAASQGELVTSHQLTRGTPTISIPPPSSTANFDPVHSWHPNPVNFQGFPHYPWGPPPYFYPFWSPHAPSTSASPTPLADDRPSTSGTGAGDEPVNMQAGDTQLDLGDALAAEFSDISDDDGSDICGMGEEDNLHNILSDMEDFFEIDETAGPDTLPKIAHIINAGFRTTVSQEKTKTLCGIYPRPGNCENLVVPKLNEEVFHTLSRSAQLRDKAMQHTQKLVLTASIPIIRIMESLLSDKGKVDPKKSLKQAGDCLQLMASAFANLSFHRRDSLRPSLSDQYKRLCNSSNPVTSFLLGDDLTKQMKDINEAGKLSRDLHRAPRLSSSHFKQTRRFSTNHALKPYQRNQPSHQPYRQQFNQPRKPF